MKALQRIILLFMLFFTLNNLFSQSITFKKVYSGIFGGGPFRFNVFCKPLYNENSFLLAGGGIRLKINKAGDIVIPKGFSNSGWFTHFESNGLNKLFIYSNYGMNKTLKILDTSLNILYPVHQYDSLDIYWQRNVDKNIISKTLDKGFILSGNYCLNPNGYHLNILIYKTDSIGNILWSKYFSPMLGGIEDILQTRDSGFVIAANLENAGASLIKTDNIGNVLWAKSYFRPRGFVHSVVENSDGTIMMTGSVDSVLTFPYYDGIHTSPLFFVKLNKMGNVIWAKSFGDSIYNLRQFPTQIIQTKDSGNIILATLARPNQMDDLLLIKTDMNGDTLWVRAHGSIQSWDNGQSIEQLNDKGYIITGETVNNIPTPTYDTYLIRTDSLGHTDSLCEEYSLPMAINNISVDDSDIVIISVPYIIHTSIGDSNSGNFNTYAYDGCHLDAIPELYLEQTAPLSIFPNPSEGRFTIEMKINTPLKTEIEIYNINGEKVYSAYTVNATSDIDLTSFSRGLYFVKMSNERWVKTGKVMIQ